VNSRKPPPRIGIGSRLDGSLALPTGWGFVRGLTGEVFGRRGSAALPPSTMMEARNFSLNFGGVFCAGLCQDGRELT